MDDECEVCLQPAVDWSTVTFETPQGSLPVRFCRDCLTAVFQLMASRYNAAIEEGNAAVAAMKKMFGFDEDSAEGAPHHALLRGEGLNAEEFQRRYLP